MKRVIFKRGIIMEFHWIEDGTLKLSHFSFVQMIEEGRNEREKDVCSIEIHIIKLFIIFPQFV